MTQPKTNVHELTGRDLDRAVALALGWEFVHDPASSNPNEMVWHTPDRRWLRWSGSYRPTDGDPDRALPWWHTNWFMTGELLELMQPHWPGGMRIESIDTLLGTRIVVSFYRASEELYSRGSTIQEAVARAVVLWKRDYR